MLVSVIVPIYNSERYLKECVDSIINQSYKNIEVLLIDDGSNDNSEKICDYYDGLDDRIVVVHNTNRGVSNARNCGIEISKGDYICFVDSDDYLDTKFIESMVVNCKDVKYDLVVCRNYNVSSNVVKETAIPYEQTFSNDLKEDYYKLTSFLGGPVMKLYRRKIMENNELYFNELVSYSEDRVFNSMFYKHVKEYLFVNQPLYYIVDRNPNSLSKQKSLKTFVDAVDEVIFTAGFLIGDNFKNSNQVVINHCIDVISNFAKSREYDYNVFSNQVSRLKEFFCLNKEGISLKRKLVILLIRYKLLYLAYIYYRYK